MGIFAKQNIATGAELTYDYCFQHEGLSHNGSMAMYRYGCCQQVFGSKVLSGITIIRGQVCMPACGSDIV